MKNSQNRILVLLFVILLVFGCESSSDDKNQSDGDVESGETSDGDIDMESDGDSENESDIELLPNKLAFHVERKAAGEPLSKQELEQVAKTVTGFWNKVNYFEWVDLTSYGMAKENEWNYPDYKIWWQNTVAVKKDDLVTFRHTGGADNVMLRMARLMTYTMAGYHATGEERLKQISISYLRGIRALFDAGVWGDEDPVIDTIMLRAIFNHSHGFVQEGDRKTYIDYEPVKFEDIARRHDTLHNPKNPTWGDIWVRTKRSKDDVPFLYRMTPLMMRIIEQSDDAEFVNEVEMTLKMIEAFAKDILDHDYVIRTKDGNGKPFSPMYQDKPDDYSTFTNYDAIWPLAECNAKLVTALIAEKNDGGNKCEQGSGGGYEPVTIASHYWSTAIIQYFHIAAVASALIEGENDIAYELVKGLATRGDIQIHDDEGRKTTEEWDADAAMFLITSASYGLPLTAEETRFIKHELERGIAHYLEFPYWDLWSKSIPDGEYDYLPSKVMPTEQPQSQNRVFRPIEIPVVFEYCESPFRDPKSEQFIDCDIVLDPEKWGK